MLELTNPLATSRLTTYAGQLESLVVLYLPRVVMAIVVLVVGWWVIGWASRLVREATAGSMFRRARS